MLFLYVGNPYHLSKSQKIFVSMRGVIEGGGYLTIDGICNSIFASRIYLLIMHHMHELCVLHEYLVYSNIVRISFDQPWTFRIVHNPQMSGCVTVNTTLDDKERCCFYLL